MKKKKSTGFGKEIYLLGADKEGIKYWLEAPSWDCGWYWGFGYIETYTNNKNPSRSRDILSHDHALEFLKWWETYNNTPKLKETTFSEKEGWELTELFKEFYLFREIAELYHRGFAGVTPVLDMKDEEKANQINEEVLPKIMNKIIEILTPEKEKR